MSKIAIFYHCLFYLGDPPELLENAVNIARDQMQQLRNTGLLAAASEFWVGLNGGEESRQIANLVIPSNANLLLHGLQCRNENRTLLALENWLPGHEDWYVFYFHAKGCSHPEGHYLSTRWRACLMRNLVQNWRQCVRDLDQGYEVVGCHYMEPPQTPDGQRIFAGNFFLARASYLGTLPSIMARDRIKVSGIDALESRYESEVWIGNGPRKPKLKDYHGPGWNPSKIATCQ